MHHKKYFLSKNLHNINFGFPINVNLLYEMSVNNIEFMVHPKHNLSSQGQKPDTVWEKNRWDKLQYLPQTDLFFVSPRFPQQPAPVFFFVIYHWESENDDIPARGKTPLHETYEVWTLPPYLWQTKTAEAVSHFSQEVRGEGQRQITWETFSV